MSPFSKSECIKMLALVASFAPGMSQVVKTVELIADVIEKVDDNKDQAGYLLRRCTELCLHVNKVCLESKADGQFYEPIEKLTITLNKVHVTMRNLSKTTSLRCYLQRHEIADIIKDSHRSLDDCLRLFEIQALSTLLFDQREYEDGRKDDNARLLSTLDHVSEDISNIKNTEDRILDIVCGLRNEVSKYMGDETQFQKDIVQRILTKLSQEQMNHRAAAFSQYWIISSCQISFIEGDTIDGGQEAITIGRWNRTKVAVKKLKKGTTREDLRREFDMWRRLQHPHIATFLRACTETDPPLLISELYEFGNVLNYLDKFPDANRLKLCCEIALGMCFLHGENIIHGDLKPINILVDDGHHARITKFGLSKYKSSINSTTAPLAGSLSPAKGAWAFKAPELLQDGKLSFAADVYAFAISVYQLMTGETPFEGLAAGLFYFRVVEGGERPEPPAEGDPAIARGLNKAMWDLLLRCWAQDRHDRPKFDEIETTLQFLPTI